MGKLIYEAESYRIRGALFEVYKQMGHGFLESVYQECLTKEFRVLSIPFQREVDLRLEYKGEALVQKYRADFICFNRIMLEIKAVKTLDSSHKKQVFNYLKATGLTLGILANFGSAPKMQIERIVL